MFIFWHVIWRQSFEKDDGGEGNLLECSSVIRHVSAFSVSAISRRTLLQDLLWYVTGLCVFWVFQVYTKILGKRVRRCIPGEFIIVHLIAKDTQWILSFLDFSFFYFSWKASKSNNARIYGELSTIILHNS